MHSPHQLLIPAGEIGGQPIHCRADRRACTRRRVPKVRALWPARHHQTTFYRWRCSTVGSRSAKPSPQGARGAEPPPEEAVAPLALVAGPSLDNAMLQRRGRRHPSRALPNDLESMELAGTHVKLLCTPEGPRAADDFIIERSGW